MSSRDYDWFVKADMTRYKGNYVIIRERKVVFSGKNLSQPIAKFRSRYPRKTPIVTKIPKDEALILATWDRECASG